MVTLAQRLEGFRDIRWKLRSLFLECWYRPELEVLYDAIGAKRLDEAECLQEDLQRVMGDHLELAKTRAILFRMRTIGR